MIDETEEKVLDFAGKFGVADLMKRAKARQVEENGQPGGTETPPERPAAVPAGDDEAEDVPEAGDAYVAHSRVENKPQLMLGLVLGDSSLIYHAYSDLRWLGLLPGKGPGEGPVLLIRFLGVSDVVVEGRNLDRLVRPLRLHRLGWLRELPARRDFRDDRATVITRITLKEPER